MAVQLMGFGAGMAWLRSLEISFTAFFISSPNERDGTVSFGTSNIEIMSMIY